ncbi:hypothetical protein [Kribbella sindirgiensis]|uniref:DUF2264 domain-containing protein n=1 Tax=Kribbella sindirgiensis TaxID=1124744 RepID=A0A4R0IUX9_9ACTN|nr:hypothetical protein [Kribbella sindirgiensis]TCC37089.1 hypothetical protein E0H50_10465 [Kribbella sindirgiensis]
MLRKLVIGVAVIATLLAGVGTARLVLPWTDPARGAVKQLAFLRAELEGGADLAAQKQFPEGYFFLNVLYGLTWVQVGVDDPARSADATAEVRWALDRIASAAGTAPFDESLQPRYGVFYAGWTNWLRGGLIALGHSDAADRDTFASESVEIATAFRTAKTPFLAAYPGQAWPVDSVVAIASLRLYDALVAPRFGQIARNWVTTAKTKLDPATGLLPHQVVPQVSGARGSSQAMIQRFLIDVDPAFARTQYELFKDKFVTGLGVREYPKGTSGPGDVDSGPLVLGRSLSATVVTVGAARVHHDPLADRLARQGELVGLPVSGLKTKRYLFGAVPIGDAFLTWSSSARPLVATDQNSGDQAAFDGASGWWRLPWLVLLWLPALILWGGLRLRHRGRRRKRGH